MLCCVFCFSSSSWDFLLPARIRCVYGSVSELCVVYFSHDDDESVFPSRKRVHRLGCRFYPVGDKFCRTNERTDRRRVQCGESAEFQTHIIRKLRTVHIYLREEFRFRSVVAWLAGQQHTYLPTYMVLLLFGHRSLNRHQISGHHHHRRTKLAVGLASRRK